MQKKEIIEKIIYPAFDEIRETLPETQSLPNKEDVIFLGKNASIDSMGLVSLLIAIEEQIFNLTEKNFDLVDEKTMSEINGPFKNVQTLSEYIYKLLLL